LRATSLFAFTAKILPCWRFADDRLACRHCVREYSVLLAVGPSTRGVLALQTAIPIPGPHSGVDNNVDRTRDYYRAVAACLDLQHRLDVDSGRNSLFHWIMALQKSGEHFSGPQLIGVAELLPSQGEQRLVISGIRDRICHPVYLGHLCRCWLGVSAGSLWLMR